MTTGEPTAQVGTGQSTAITTDKASASKPARIQRGFDIVVGNNWAYNWALGVNSNVIASLPVPPTDGWKSVVGT